MLSLCEKETPFLFQKLNMVKKVCHSQCPQHVLHKVVQEPVKKTRQNLHHHYNSIAVWILHLRQTLIGNTRQSLLTKSGTGIWKHWYSNIKGGKSHNTISLKWKILSSSSKWWGWSLPYLQQVQVKHMRGIAPIERYFDYIVSFLYLPVFY